MGRFITESFILHVLLSALLQLREGGVGQQGYEGDKKQTAVIPCHYPTLSRTSELIICPRLPAIQRENRASVLLIPLSWPLVT